MTIIVSVQVNDGIALAADSATTFVSSDGRPVKIYNNANKIFNLRKVWPIGAMTYGSANIGNASIATLSKDFRRLLTEDGEWKLEADIYTIEQVAERAKQFLYDKTFLPTHPDGRSGFYLGYRIFGYSAGASLPEAWEVRILENRVEGPVVIHRPGEFGIRWAGENEALDRLLFGISQKAVEVMVDLGADTAAAQSAWDALLEGLSVQLFIPAMPIQDAIDLSTFLASTAANFTRFSIGAATVGGPIEVATISKHEGFKWVSRKHYYSTEFNETGDFK